MKSKNNLLLVIISTLIIVLTITLFILLFKPLSAAKITGLCFLVFSELLCSASAIFFAKKKQNLFSLAGVSVALAIYFGATLILALLSPVFEDKVWLEVTLEFVAIMVAGLISASVLLVGRYVKNVDKSTKEKLDKGEFNKPKRGGF